MKLPLLLSVPHAGLQVPPEAASYCVLTPRQIEEDGDEGAAEIYYSKEASSYVPRPVRCRGYNWNYPEVRLLPICKSGIWCLRPS